jgi:hypothetical protein
MYFTARTDAHTTGYTSPFSIRFMGFAHVCSLNFHVLNALRKGFVLILQEFNVFVLNSLDSTMVPARAVMDEQKMSMAATLGILGEGCKNVIFPIFSFDSPTAAQVWIEPRRYGDNSQPYLRLVSIGPRTVRGIVVVDQMGG